METIRPPDPRSGPERTLPPGLRIRRSVQQQSTATTELSNAFGFIQMRPGKRKQATKRLLRGVRDKEVMIGTVEAAQAVLDGSFAWHQQWFI